MELIEKYLGEGKGLTKADILKKLNGILGKEWMNIDQISAKAQLPIAKDGLKAHLVEFARKGKFKEDINRGKAIWRKA